MEKGIVDVGPNYEIVSGKEFCYRDPDAARRRSGWSTTNDRGVLTLFTGSGEPLYLANGDWWINNEGRQGRHYFGLGGRLIELKESWADAQV